MKLTLTKYRFDLSEHIAVAMPEGARVLSVGMDGHRGVIEALVNEGNMRKDKRFHLIGAGASVAGHDIGRYVGKVDTVANGEWFIFEAP